MNRKRIAITLFLAVLFAFGITTDAGAIASSNTTNFSAGSRSYRDYSAIEIYTTSKLALAYTRVCCTNTSANPGYLGTYSRLYNSSGTLIGVQNWMYNSYGFGLGIYFNGGIGLPYKSRTSYYSQGIARGYNPATGKYASQTTLKSPLQTAP